MNTNELETNDRKVTPTGSITIRRAKAADAPLCGRFCFDAFYEINSNHGFPLHFTAVDVAVDLLSRLLTAINMYFISCFFGGLIHICNMHVIVDLDPGREISTPPGANIKATKVTPTQSPLVGAMVLSEAAAKEQAVVTRFILAALFGTISAFAAIFLNVIDWTVLGWRDFWLAVCIASFVGLVTFIWMACARFSGSR